MKVNVNINPKGGHSYIVVQMDMDLSLCPHVPPAPKSADSRMTVGDMFGCDSPINRNDGREEVTQDFLTPFALPRASMIDKQH